MGLAVIVTEWLPGLSVPYRKCSEGTVQAQACVVDRFNAMLSENWLPELNPGGSDWSASLPQLVISKMYPAEQYTLAQG